MGKGGGCVPSKHRASYGAASSKSQLSISKNDNIPVNSGSVQNETSNTIIANRKQKLKVFIVFYSMYRHIETLAKRTKQGVDQVEGIEGILYRVPETLPPEILDQMKVPSQDDSIPVIEVEELSKADGFLFGFPTRLGSMAGQMKAFFDSTHDLWIEQKLAGVPAGFFVSTGTQGGGQETTAWTAITLLAHHGMIYVPLGYTFGSRMFGTESIRGEPPYGAGVVVGDGTREPTETELALSEHQGKYMAVTVKRFAQPSSSDDQSRL